MLLVIFMFVALLMFTLAGRLLLISARLVRLHKHGPRAAGTVISVWEDADRDGPPQLRASIGFDALDGTRGWLHIPARRREGRLQVGDVLPIVYDPRRQLQAQVVPDASRRLLVAAVVWAVFAVGAVGFAGLMIGVGFGSA